jgi:tetratricopeptide (TPR) repeat protein
MTQTNMHKSNAAQFSARSSVIRDLLFILVLAATTFLIYANTYHSPFVFDDLRHLERNPNIQVTDLSLDSMRKAALDSPSNKRPVALITLALNYFFHQLDLPGYHLVNILVHLAAGIFLYLFLQTTFNLQRSSQKNSAAGWLPFAAALIWVVYPLHVQSVTYIIQRMNSMASMFYMLAMLCYARGRLAKAIWHKVALFSGCFAAALLAVGSKEIAATLPFFVFLYEWFFLQDLRGVWLQKRLPVIIGVTFLLGVMALFYLGVNPLKSITDGYGFRDFTLEQRLFTEFRVVVFYISLLFFPHPSRLNMDHHFVLSQALWDPAATLLSLVFLVSLIVLAIILAKRERFLSFCILWFLGNLLIESSVIGLEIIFEHRTYLPSMMAVPGIVFVCSRMLKNVWLQRALAVAVILLLGMWTFQRNIIWQDEVKLRRDSVAKSPNKPRAHAILANILERNKEFDEAAVYYSNALELAVEYNPSYVDKIHYNFGNVMLELEEYDKAVGHFKKAAANNPQSPLIALNLAFALNGAGKTDEAYAVMEELLQQFPDYARGYNNMGILLMQQGKVASAEYHFAEAVRLGHVPARLNLERARQDRAQRERTRSNTFFFKKPVR